MAAAARRVLNPMNSETDGDDSLHDEHLSDGSVAGIDDEPLLDIYTPNRVAYRNISLSCYLPPSGHFGGGRTTIRFRSRRETGFDKGPKAFGVLSLQIDNLKSYHRSFMDLALLAALK